MSNRNDLQIASEVIKEKAERWLDDQGIVYALYTIKNRALTAEDGLKPINRRILYTMFEDGVLPSNPYVKAARVAGNIMKYHPHGTASIEDALARMAQGFNNRVPLVDPYGSVGKVAGDTPAAARYWEARLTPAAVELVREVKEGGAPMGKNYDETLDEPLLLPSRWPHAVINGSQGTAVGYSSTIFPHNPSEVMKACIHLVDNPDMTVEELMEIMLGPDFPSGGIVDGVDGIAEYYETGRGKFTLKGRYKIEQLGRGKVRIIFYELPYQRSAESVKIAIQNQQNKYNRLQDVSLVNDESDKENPMRLVIETKTGTNYLKTLEELLQHSGLRVSMSANNTVLVDGKPVLMGILDQLKEFLKLRRDVNKRKGRHNLKVIDDKLLRLNAILAVLLDIDKAIKIIRQSNNQSEAKRDLRKAFSINERQAEYILNIQLRRLTKADRVSTEKEKEQLLKDRAYIEDILSDEAKMDEHIKTELRDTEKIIRSERLTEISGLTLDDAKDEVKSLRAQVRNQGKARPVDVVIFADGSLSKIDDNADIGKLVKKCGPVVRRMSTVSDREVVLVSESGVGYRVPLDYLTDNMVSKPEALTKSSDRVIGVISAVEPKRSGGFLLASRKGEIKVSKYDFPKTSESFPVFNLKDGDSVVFCEELIGSLKNKVVATFSSQGNLALCEVSEFRQSGSSAGGVRGMNPRDGEVVSACVIDWANKDLMVGTSSGLSVKLTPITEFVLKKRGGIGILAHSLKENEKVEYGVIGEHVDFVTKDGFKKVASPVVSKRHIVPTKIPVATIPYVVEPK